jgi:hypothetical protein
MIRKLIKALLKFNLNIASPRKPDSKILQKNVEIASNTGFLRRAA